MNIWAILTIVIIVISIYINKLIFRKIYRVQEISLFTVFSALWITVLVLGSFQAYDMFDASSAFYKLLFLGIAAWMLGYFLLASSRVKLRIKHQSTYGKKINSSKIEYEFNIRIIYMIEAVCLIFVLVVLLKMLNLTRGGLTMESIRDMYLGRDDADFFSSSIANVLNNKIVVPCIYALVPVSILIFLENKSRKACILATIIFIVYEIGIGGRFLLLNIIVVFFLALSRYKNILHKILAKRERKKKKKIYRRIYFLVGVLAIIIVAITIFKKRYYITGEYSRIFMSFYTYITLCLPLGDYWIDYINSQKIFTGGVTFLYGFLSNINFFVSKVGFPYLSSLLSPTVTLIKMIDDNYICVGINHYSNAFVTWIVYLYADFRELGVAVGSFLFGALTNYLTRRTYMRKTLLDYAAYLLFAQCIVKSFVRWELYLPSYLLSFLFLRFMFKRTYKL